jgi:hypothetical protein
MSRRAASPEGYRRRGRGAGRSGEGKRNWARLPDLVRNIRTAEVGLGFSVRPGRPEGLMGF